MNCHRYPDTPCRFRCTDFCRLYGIGYPKDRGGPLFLPTDLASLAGWYRYGSGITVTGAGVSQWNDNSGNARHLKQGTDANRPALQGDGSILFDGAAFFLKCDAFTLNQPETVYFLGKQVTWTALDRIFDGNNDDSGALLQRTASPGLAINAGSNVGENNGLAVDAYGVVSAVFNGASSALQVNNGTAVTGDSGPSNMGGFTLGKRGASATLFSNIRVKEVIIYAAAHNATQRAKVIEYLARVGNLTI